MPPRPALGFFVADPLDRQATRRADPDWLAERLAAPETRFVEFVGDRPVIAAGAIAWRTAAALAPPMAGTGPVFLGVAADGVALFASQAAADAAVAVGEGEAAVDLRALAVQGLVPPEALGLLAQARSLTAWHTRHRFCSNCGGPSEPADGGYRRRCPACRGDHFPRTDPVAIVAVTGAAGVLLGRQPQFAPGVYSALAGYIEPGETIEQAARREILEEAGIRLGRIEYRMSQPWPFPSTLMIGVHGEAESHDITIDRAELEDVRWFGLDEIARMRAGSHPDGLKLPAPISIAWQLLAQVSDAAVGS